MLLDAEAGDEETGLLCEAVDGSEKLTLPLAGVLVKNGRHRQLIGDYRQWLWSGDSGELRYVEPAAEKHAQRQGRVDHRSVLPVSPVPCM